MFEEADLENITNLKLIGKKFRDTILSLGGSLSPLEIFKLFKERATNRLIIRHLGLSEATIIFQLSSRQRSYSLLNFCVYIQYFSPKFKLVHQLGKPLNPNK